MAYEREISFEPEEFRELVASILGDVHRNLRKENLYLKVVDIVMKFELDKLFQKSSYNG